MHRNFIFHCLFCDSVQVAVLNQLESDFRETLNRLSDQTDGRSTHSRHSTSSALTEPKQHLFMQCIKLLFTALLLPEECAPRFLQWRWLLLDGVGTLFESASRKGAINFTKTTMPLLNRLHGELAIITGSPATSTFQMVLFSLRISFDSQRLASLSFLLT